MKKRVLICMFLLVLMLAVSVLVACDDGTPDDDSPTACTHTWGKWIGTDEGHYHVCTLCGDESQVFNHNYYNETEIVGTDYVTECKLCGYKNHTPIYPVIEVVDADANATYLAEINQAIKSINEFGLTSDITARMQMVMQGQDIFNLNFSCKNSESLYFVTRGESEVIYQEEDGRIFAYTHKRGTYYQRSYVCDRDDFTLSSDTLDSVDTESELVFDASKCNITKDGSKYVVEAYARDLIDEETMEMLVELYEELGLDADFLQKMVVTAEYEFSDVSYKCREEMTIYVSANDTTFEFPFDIYMSIDYSQITPIDFSSGEYTFSPPSCIEEIMTTSPITEVLITDGRFYRLQLKKGQYHMSTSSIFVADIYVYDENGNEIAWGIDVSDEDSSISDYNYNVIIPSDGIYYVSIGDGEYGTSDTVSFIECDYETIYDVDNPKTFTLNVSGTVEGMYDIENYVFTSEHEELLAIENKSDVTIRIYVNGSYRNIDSGETGCFAVKAGENTILVTSSADESVSYSLSYTELYDANGADRNNLETMSEEWSNDFLLGYGLEKRYIKLHVTERGVYEIKFQSTLLYGETGANDIDCGIEGDYSGTFYSYSRRFLEVGDYEIWLKSYSQAMKVKVKYEFHTAKDLDINVELPVCKDSEVYSIDAIKSQRVDRGQLVKYHFTLNESSIVRYNEVKIYNEDGKQCSFNLANSLYIKLPAGKYYCTADKYWQDDGEVKIFIVTDFKGTYIDFENMPILVKDVKQSFYIEKGEYVFFKFEIENDGEYVVPCNYIDDDATDHDYSFYVHIFDENMNAMNAVFDNGYVYDLKKGEYYVAVSCGLSGREYNITLQSAN